MKFGHLKMAAAAVALAGLPAVATAQAKVPPSHQMGFYIGAGGGLSTADFDNASFAPPAGTGRTSDDTDLSGKGFVGYRFHKHFGVEGGYYYLGKFSNNFAGPGGTGTVTNTVDAWVLDAVGYLPLNENFSFIGRLGAVNGEIDTQLVGTVPSNLAPISKKSTNFTWGLGAQLDIDNRWALRAEYENFGSFGDGLTGKLRASMWSGSAIIKF